MKKESSTLQLVRQICRALDAKKAEALRVSDVRAYSSITDYIIVATGTADTHLRALRVELEKVLDAAGAQILGMDGQRESGWLVVDAFEVMVHLFLGETRQHYRLEQLWQDAPTLDVAELIEEPKPAARAAAAPKKKAVSAVKKPAAKPTKKKAAPKKSAAVSK
ncbi:hypothetical protein AXK12_00720 [Cephaloticoccus capnophilus]|uniref:Ribosomal silencing factor RsfS n=1 Tax=Cephaloticoccus capnophilus TaxID=1548208 RepID=A0A139SUD4_9BACT|nr:ribosome silencing factor [Cephaloticoccus capnophilus]KXU38061.1 hypothetical protein AXK12_00720 [Cephaloticoccus capnophilus]